MSTELSVLIRVQIINEKIHALKQDFERYIADKSFPLEERWNVFLEASTDLSNNECYIQHLDSVDTVQFHDNGARGQVTAEGVIEMFMGNYELDRESEGDYSPRTEAEWAVIKEKAIPVKEELLARNLKSWLIDW